jgi:ribonucleoside-triphosphate reductase
MCAKINHAKRKIVQKRIDNGNHPLYDLGFIDINTQYSTCGINGFNEAISYLGQDIKTEEGTQLGLEIINVINTVNDKMQKRFKTPHNCEQIPAENVSIKLAKKDQLLKYQTEYNLYSNQFIPLIVNADLLDRIRLQGVFDKHFSGGSIMHISCDERLEDVEDMKLLIKTCAKQGVIYFAINYLLRKCKNGHMTVGSSNICSICGEEIEDFYTRVVGFLTNIKNWHKVRRTEDAPNRQMYNSDSIGKASK